MLLLLIDTSVNVKMFLSDAKQAKAVVRNVGVADPALGDGDGAGALLPHILLHATRLLHTQVGALFPQC